MTKSSLFLKGLAIFVCLFLFAGITSAQTTKNFLVTKDSTWTIPTTLDDGITPMTVTSVTFEAIGAGGAGGYMPWGLTRRGGGGGGGGAYATVTVSNPTGSFQIMPGIGGTNPMDGPTVSGSASIVKQGGSNILVAAGGASSPYTNRDGGTGALGGQASACIPTTGAHSGGNGADAYGLLLGWLFSYSGGGGGAANSTGDGNDALSTDAVTGGTPGSGTMPAGKGGNGIRGESADGVIGATYGGGGSGATAYTILSSGDGNNGGAGAPGVVRVTYTYTAEYIDVKDADTTICSGTDYDVTLDVTVDGYNLNEALMSVAITPPAELSGHGPSIAYNTTDHKWHITGDITNSTSNTVTLTINGTAKSKGEIATDNFTVTVNVYGKLDGGVIAEDQLVCQGQTIQTLTSVTDATGGSGSGSYQWWQWVTLDETGNSGSNTWEQISGANSSTYTPMLSGLRYFARQYKDNVCGNVYATDGAGSQYLNVTTVDPYTFKGGWSSDDTICSTVSSYSKTLGWEMATPAYLTSYGQYWQKSTDKGTTWTNLAPGFVSGYSPYSLTLNSSDLTAGSDLWYRAAVKISDCDSIPSNEIYKIHVREVADYTTQFPDVNITLWYGACDTSTANLTAPTLDPTPVSIVRVDGLDRIPAGEHNIVWKVNDGCSEATYTQKVTVNYPACGATVTDANGREYQTVRVGCDCWIAENLKTNADGAAYYNEDNANEGFGKLYDWNAAVGSNNTEQTCKTGTYIQGVCPDGWALPTVAKFNNMLAEFGDIEALKSDDETTWLPGNAGTNTSGFGAKGAGYYEGMQYQRQLGYTYFWTCELNPSNSLVARTVELRCGCGEFTVYDKSKESKVSVRCVKVELND
jgi:uncharacterized protein (TIGR02145 family)